MKSHLALARKRTPPFHNFQRSVMYLRLVQFCASESHWNIYRPPFVQRNLQVISRNNSRLLLVSSATSVTWPMMQLYGYVQRRLRTTNMINVLPQANAIKFITLKPETSQKVQKISNRFWLAGILFSLTHGILKVSFQHVSSMICPRGINSSLWEDKPLDQRDAQNQGSGREKYR